MRYLKEYFLRSPENDNGGGGDPADKATPGEGSASPSAGEEKGAGDSDTGIAPAADSGVKNGEEPSASSDAPAPDSQEPKPVVKAKNPDWRDNHIAKLQEKLRVKDTELVAAKSQLSQGSSETDEAFNLRVEERAIALAQQSTQQAQLRTQLTDLFKEGRTEYGEKEFDLQVAELQRIRDPGDAQEMAAYMGLIETAMETGKGAKVLFSLAGDLDEAARVMALSPKKQAIELERLANREPKPISSAPKPILPIGTRKEQHTSISASDKSRGDNLSTEEWMRRRNQEITERKQQNGTRR